MAKPSEVTEICDADFPKSLSVIDLPGHFFDMIGIRTPDGVAFIADCLNSKETLDKYKFTFIYDVESISAYFGAGRKDAGKDVRSGSCKANRGIYKS